MSALHSGPLLAERDGLRVINCRACGWAHLDPLPVMDDAYYRDTFWTEKGAGWLARYEAERDWLDMRHGDWLSVIEENTAGRTLLDVGCGYGFFMRAAKSRSWHPVGIEPSREAYEYSHSEFPIWPSSWDTLDLALADCISAFWLLEHLPDPLAFLAWCRAHLAPGGVLAVCVPQEWTMAQQEANLMVNIPNWFVHPTHINYWNCGTLSNLLGRSGFRVVDRLSSYPMELFIIEGQDYTNDDVLGSECHKQIQSGELSMTRIERLGHQRKFGLAGAGRDLLVIAKVDA